MTGGNHETIVERLTGREREVLELVAAGRSNRSIAETLFLSGRAVEKHITAIFMKLDLCHDDVHLNRRVSAVLRYRELSSG